VSTFKLSLLLAGLLAILKLTVAPAVSWWAVALIPVAGLLVQALLVLAFFVLLGLWGGR